MAPRLDIDREPPGLIPDPPDLSRVAETGATILGNTVRRIVVEWDGGRLECTLPDPDDGAGGMKDRILAALKKSAGPMTRKALAKALDLESAKGRFGRTVSAMVDTGDIEDRAGYLSDDPSKYPAES